MNEQFHTGVIAQIHVARFFHVEGREQIAFAEDWKVHRGAQSHSGRIGYGLVFQLYFWFDGVTNGQAQREAPAVAAVGGEHIQRMHDNAEVHAHAAAAVARQAVVAEFQCAAHAPRIADAATVTEQELALAVGQTVVEQRVAVVATFDVVDAEMANR